MIAKLFIFLYDVIFGKSGIILLIILLSYKYGYPIYQNYKISKLETSIKADFKKNLINYKIPLRINISAYSENLDKIELSIDTSNYPKVEIIYIMKDYEEKTFPTSYAIQMNNGCSFYYDMFGDTNTYKAIAMQNILINDNVKFYHQFKNKFGEQLSEKIITASDCFSGRKLKL